jgi:hypothetical protein
MHNLFACVIRYLDQQLFGAESDGWSASVAGCQERIAAFGDGTASTTTTTNNIQETEISGKCGGATRNSSTSPCSVTLAIE